MTLTVRREAADVPLSKLKPRFTEASPRGVGEDAAAPRNVYVMSVPEYVADEASAELMAEMGTPSLRSSALVPDRPLKDTTLSGDELEIVPAKATVTALASAGRCTV